MVYAKNNHKKKKNKNKSEKISLKLVQNFPGIAIRNVKLSLSYIICACRNTNFSEYIKK